MGIFKSRQQKRDEERKKKKGEIEVAKIMEIYLGPGGKIIIQGGIPPDSNSQYNLIGRIVVALIDMGRHATAESKKPSILKAPPGFNPIPKA